MTLPSDIAHIEKLHLVAEANGDTSFEHHMRATLLRAYRELAHERDEWRRLQHKAGLALESRILECDRLRDDFQFQQNKADSVVTLNLALEAERDRLRASHAKLQQLLERLDACLEPHALAGVSRDPEDLQVRASHAQEFWCALMDVRTALADAQHPEQQPQQRPYYETHEPPHCPTCGCGHLEQQPDIDAFLGEGRKPVRSLASVMVTSARDPERQPDSDARPSSYLAVERAITASKDPNAKWPDSDARDEVAK